VKVIGREGHIGELASWQRLHVRRGEKQQRQGLVFVFEMPRSECAAAALRPADVLGFHSLSVATVQM